ncbi:MAG: hypothetical protein PQJ58_06935 [Spirochaetales bacterium]|nr:hypothetical protein [Spirochaetales bacterium]
MTTAKKTILLPFILMITSLLWGAENRQNENILDEIDRLIANRQYQTAWTTLHDRAEALETGDMILKKTELTLLYYTKTNLHQMFAFSDLKEGENLSDARAGDGNFDFKLFDPAGALSLVISSEPGRTEAYFWLGEYYYQVMNLYAEVWDKPVQEIRSLVLANFKMAVSLGMETEEIYSKMAYTELLSANWEGALKDLEKALIFNPGNPSYYHDKAVASLNLGHHTDALASARQAMEEYKNPFYKADSAFLASTIALHMGESGTAEDYLVKGAAYSPDDYRFPDRLIRLYLNDGEYEKARKAAGNLFALYPDNPANCTTIIQYFYNIGKLEETELFFTEQLDKFSGNPAARGNLFFHKGIAAKYRGLNTQALEAFENAEDEFKKSYAPDNPVFAAIDNMRAELRTLLQE